MTSTYSTLLQLELIGSGEQANAWGNTTNNNLQYGLEYSIAGVYTKNLSAASSPYVLTVELSTKVHPSVVSSSILYNSAIFR